MKTINLKRYLLAGLVVWLPILVTIVVLRFIIDLLDGVMALLPKAYQPEQWFGMHIPGLGAILSLLLLLATGIFVTNFLGQRMVVWGESLLARIPLVRSIYNAVKQVINTIVSSNGDAFRKVMLIEYPRKDMWSLAFQTGVVKKEISDEVQQEMISLFIPTTPNPTSGFLVMLPKTEAIELSMSIDEALKLIISLGVMQSNQQTISTTL
ncbi:MAG: hypothetical protein CK426_04175 [Legionella sp.]|nr:MAG: hypothetical protein CK423_03175 [Legionella sp.]PJD99022.1 MAG: hypothetical protein CK426_04175 [Legionella sp.]